MNIESSFSAEFMRPLSSAEVRSFEPFFVTPSIEFFIIPLDDGRSTVAKRLPVAYRDDPAQRDQFVRECTYLKALGHPGIAVPQIVTLQKHEIIQVLAPCRYLTLRQLTETCGRLERRLPLDIAVYIVEAITEAVSYIEKRATRDNQDKLDIVLHPDTLLVDPEGKITVTNIGLTTPPYLTSSILSEKNRRYFVYAAPEQCVAGRSPDARACYYSLGMLCYELLTGHPLFSASTVRDLDAVSRRKIRRLHPLASDVDAALDCVDDLICRLLEPVPEKRESNLDAVARELDAVPTAGRADKSDLASCLTALEQAQTDGMQHEEDASRLSVTTDISEYNAS